jgi:4-amino-4-deoxy-L-arabinose transferase-like glycosyltransferase
MGLPVLDVRHAVFALIGISTILHVLASGAVGLGNDESYTVANARIPSWSYVDYPPLHVWLVGAWSAFTHSEAPLVVRLPFITFFAGSTWLMYSITTLLFDRRSGFWAALAFNLAPVYAIAHGSWVLPDGPLTFFMLAGAFVVARQVFGEHDPSRISKNWMIAGALTGLALLTKYHGAFLIAGTLAFFLTWVPGRQILRTPGPWLAVCIALVIFSPVIFWNGEHGWSGLFFQSARLTKSVNLSFSRVIANVGGQAAYLSPWLFIPLTIALYRAIRNGPRIRETWFPALLACGPILFFTGASLFAKGLPHWSMPGWLFAFPLLGRQLCDWERTHPRVLHASAAAAVALTLCALTLFIGETRYGWITGASAMRTAEHNPTLDLLDWHDVGAAIRVRHLIDAETPAVAGTSWMTAGKLNYTVGRTVPVLCLCDDPQQFRYLNDPANYNGHDIIVVQTPWQYQHNGPALRKSFESLKLLAPIVLQRGGRDALRLVVLRGKRLKPFAGGRRD